MSVYIPVALRRQVRLDAKMRCGYCLSSEAVIGIANDEYVVQSRRFWVILGIHPPVE